MPLDYRIDPSRKVVISTATGIVTYQDITSHQNRLLQDPEFSANYDQLIDCRFATDIQLSAEQSRQIAYRTMFSTTSRRVLIAAKPVVFGVGRMLHAYHECSPAPSRAMVFYDLAEGLNWLDRPDLELVI